MTAQTAKCRCQHCDTKIEFDIEHAGQATPCPQCGMETVLFIPPPEPQMPKEKPIPVAKLAAVPASEAIAGRVSRRRVVIFTAVFFGLSALCALLSFSMPNSTPEEDALMKKISAVQEKTDALDKLATKYLDEGSSESYSTATRLSSKLYGEVFEDRVRLNTLRHERVIVINFLFWSAIALCVFWVPGTIYLFLVPASLKTRTIAPLCS